MKIYLKQTANDKYRLVIINHQLYIQRISDNALFKLQYSLSEKFPATKHKVHVVYDETILWGKIK